MPDRLLLKALEPLSALQGEEMLLPWLTVLGRAPALLRAGSSHSGVPQKSPEMLQGTRASTAGGNPLFPAFRADVVMLKRWCQTELSSKPTFCLDLPCQASTSSPANPPTPPALP